MIQSVVYVHAKISSVGHLSKTSILQTQYNPSHLTLEVRLTPLFAIIIPLRFKEVKTDYMIYYKPPTRFAVVKTDSLNDYMPPKCFVVVKTDSPNFYKPLAHFTEIKTNSPNSY